MVVEKIKIGVAPRVGGRENSGCIRVGFHIRLQLWTVAVPSVPLLSNECRRIAGVSWD